MIVTGAFLATAARVSEGQLDVWGGVLDSYGVADDRTVSVVLVVLSQTEPGDTGAQVNLEVIPPSGDTGTFQFEVPEGTLSGENGFAFWPIHMAAPVDGKYVFLVTGGGGSVSLPMYVDHQ